MEIESGRQHLRELAGRIGRQGQRRRSGIGEADARFHRLRRTDLRGPEQNGVRFREECRRAISSKRISTPSTEAAAGAAKDMPADFRVSITNAPGKNAYPISSFTWLLIPDKIDNATKKKSITDFLQWMMTTGQGYAEGMGYAPLPKPVVAKEQKQIALIK